MSSVWLNSGPLKTRLIALICMTGAWYCLGLGRLRNNVECRFQEISQNELGLTKFKRCKTWLIALICVTGAWYCLRLRLPASAIFCYDFLKVTVVAQFHSPRLSPLPNGTGFSYNSSATAPCRSLSKDDDDPFPIESRTDNHAPKCCNTRVSLHLTN